MNSGPEHYEHIQELISIEKDGADKRRWWVVVLGLSPKLDGDQWCFLWGEDLAVGVAGFGASPIEAMLDFDRSMYASIPKRSGDSPEGGSK
jgi:hypothetical protein